MTSTPLYTLFQSDVTRDISPVVYFHEQSPEKVQAEVSEYIITGGWPEGHPNRQRVPDGIHEQYVRLLRGITRELEKPGGPELPTAWISGFFGSGKSIFAKLLGLALDGMTLPDGTSLSEAWLKRDSSPLAAEFKEAWAALRQKIDPMAVVFDIGSVARDNEHVHAVALGQVQKRLGYCSTEPLVADFELKLERDGHWPMFLEKAEQTLGEPWSAVKDQQLAEEQFSLVLSELFPELYRDPMAWFESRAGTHQRRDSPEDVVKAIRDMLKHRNPNATLFLVIDEVSQYVLNNTDRTDRLRAFASALGSTLRGKAWLLALGQQKLDEAAGDTFLAWAKDRFPPQLQVHLAPTNIRDVVHQRILAKTPDGAAQLRELFDRHRADLKLYAYGCEDTTADAFVDVYPLLPGQIELILRITSVLRTRSSRAQGDDQAIRGLLQLLGELFRRQQLAEAPIGTLVSLDRVYEVQYTALDADTQASMARIQAQCTGEGSELMLRTAKAVALLELIQDTDPTTEVLVAKCLAERMDGGNQQAAVRQALEELRRQNLLHYSEKDGFKIQSTAGEEWERDRADFAFSRQDLSKQLQESLKLLMGDASAVERPRLDGRPFPWEVRYSDGRYANDAQLLDPRDDACLTLDLRCLPLDERVESVWVRRSAEDPLLKKRLLWIAGNSEAVEDLARELHRSAAIIQRFQPRRESLPAVKQRLLLDEQTRRDALIPKLKQAIAQSWMEGTLYFQGRSLNPRDSGQNFAATLLAAGNQALPLLYPHFRAIQILPAELNQLLQPELNGASTKFLPEGLGILELDTGRYVPSCSGEIPRRVLQTIEDNPGQEGAELLKTLGSAPYGYAPGVVKACVAGLLRGGKIAITPETGPPITARRDAGVQDLFDKDRSFRKARIGRGGDGGTSQQERARICKLFHVLLKRDLDREEGPIADAVAELFPGVAKRLRDVQTRLSRLPWDFQEPAVLAKLQTALEQSLRNPRLTRPTVEAVLRHLDALRDGISTLQVLEAEVQDTTVEALREAHTVVTRMASQLESLGVTATNVEAAATRVHEKLDSPEPWRGLGDLEGDLDEIRAAYRSERSQLLLEQEQRLEASRQKVRGCRGFSTLGADQSHAVLKPFASCATSTDAEAIAPGLVDLRDPFVARLQRAEKVAVETLDSLLVTTGKERQLTQSVDLGLQNRELNSEADVLALAKEIEARLLPLVQQGGRVRIL
ncbi:MAG: BREX system P-loop protein BrxC [Cyanobacteria bacterium]|nr:BREX system P-loop protein BrxC [Cyanobacteriota bacterium]